MFPTMFTSQKNQSTMFFYTTWKVDGASTCIGLSWLFTNRHLLGIAPSTFNTVYHFFFQSFARWRFQTFLSFFTTLLGISLLSHLFRNKKIHRGQGTALRLCYSCEKFPPSSAANPRGHQTLVLRSEKYVPLEKETPGIPTSWSLCVYIYIIL